MRHERLAPFIQAHCEARDADPAHQSTHEAMLNIFTALSKREVTEGQALRLLGYQAALLADEPDRATLFRQAAADLRQMRA